MPSNKKPHGDPLCYRAYVGHNDRYDWFAGAIFCLLFNQGLRENHKLLDIGCGSLRVGRLLIPYLASENYYGIEPNEKILDDGIRYEIGKELLVIKKANIYRTDNSDNLTQKFDFILAHSIFSHTGQDLLDYWMSEGSRLLKPTGKYIASFFQASKDYQENGWVYPKTVHYSFKKISNIAKKFNLTCTEINWQHISQKWILLRHENR